MWFEWKSEPSEDFSGRIGVYVNVKRKTEGWLYVFLCFDQMKNRKREDVIFLYPVVLSCLIPLNGRCPADGLLLESIYHYSTPRTFNHHIPDSPPPLFNLDYVGGDLVESLRQEFITIVLFSIGLLHCKNIVLEEYGGKNPNIKNRRHRSKGTQHHVLKVLPAREIKKTVYEQAGKSSPQSLHFIRGHFKEYTTEKPLFGKYTGIYWWEAHVAGKAEIGKVTKDYQVFPKSAVVGASSN
jgi:hypothetical protein